MAQRSNDPQFQNREGNRALPLLVLEECVTVLVGKLCPARKTLGCVVDVKGTDAHAISRITIFIRSAGMNKLVCKCDQESNTEAFLDDNVKRSVRAGTSQHRASLEMCTVPENSAVGSSASYGGAETTVQMAGDHLRTLKAASDARIGAKIPSSQPVVNWLVNTQSGFSQ